MILLAGLIKGSRREAVNEMGHPARHLQRSRKEVRSREMEIELRDIFGVKLAPPVDGIDASLCSPDIF